MKKVMITAALALMTMGAMAQTLDNDTTCYEPEHLFKVGVVPKFKSGKWAVIQYLYNNLRPSLQKVLKSSIYRFADLKPERLQG